MTNELEVYKDGTARPRPLVIYHGDCPDGFCAAWQAWRFFGDRADYVPALYDQPPPDVTGREVYIVDFCYPYEVTLGIIEDCRKLLILDHHKTAQEDLDRLVRKGVGRGKARIVFDMTRSGAGLARDHWHPTDVDNWIVNYAQDRDLWRFDLPDSQVINAYLHTLKYDFEVYNHVLTEVGPDEARKLGKGAQAYRDMYVRGMMRHAIRQPFAGYEDIPVVNAPYVAISDLLGELAHTGLFAVGWFQRADGSISYSLRSRGDFDVSKLAEKFGGGGHKGAAGFRLQWTVPLVERPEACNPEDQARIVLTPGQAARAMAGKITITEANGDFYWNLIAQAAIDAAKKL